MSPICFTSDVEYRRWLAAHPHGFVLNTTRTRSPNYMVLHRARCSYISEGAHEKSPGGFTERDYVKVVATGLDDLRQWVRRHGRPDGTFSSACSRCRPVDEDRNLAARLSPMQAQVASRWQLWKQGVVVHQVEGVQPLLASWEKKSSPSQVRLQAYLEGLLPRLLPLPVDGILYLHLEVDVEDSRRLARHYDLENYLTPLFGLRWLPANRFALVSARKFVGGGSRIKCGIAVPDPATSELGWSFGEVAAGSGAGARGWKEQIRKSLAAQCPTAMADGPAQVRIAWRCSATRNWSALWKPTGDAMGPVLGLANPSRPFQLNDDRIVDLELHRKIDDSLGHDVVVGYWWRLANLSNQ